MDRKLSDVDLSQALEEDLRKLQIGDEGNVVIDRKAPDQIAAGCARAAISLRYVDDQIEFFLREEGGDVGLVLFSDFIDGDGADASLR